MIRRSAARAPAPALVKGGRAYVGPLDDLRAYLRSPLSLAVLPCP